MIEDESLIGFKEQLLNLQQGLLDLEDTTNDSAKTVELDQTRVGRLSRMDALQSQAMSLEIKRRRQIELQKIAAALSRIDNNVYGNCVQCEEPIAVNRLELSPATPLCIKCASESEG